MVGDATGVGRSTPPIAAAAAVAAAVVPAAVAMEGRPFSATSRRQADGWLPQPTASHERPAAMAAGKDATPPTREGQAGHPPLLRGLSHRAPADRGPQRDPQAKEAAQVE